MRYNESRATKLTTKEWKMQAENTTEIKFSISVYVHGVKKKCRKVERHSLKLGYIPYNDGSFDKEAISQKVRDIVATNMKSVSSPIQVQMLRIELKKDEWGYSQTFAMFDERHVNFAVETALQEALK
jgi:hypothetical protein